MAMILNEIAVYGHLFTDYIYFLNSFPTENIPVDYEKRITKLGGTENFCNSFSEINKDLNIQRIEANSESIILLNKENGSRTSISTWGDYSNINTSKVSANTHWAHFMYLDKLVDLNESLFEKLKKNNSIISVDLCSDTHSVLEMAKMKNLFKYVDFLFCSDVESSDIMDIVTSQKNYTIHSPSSIVVNGAHIKNEDYEPKVENMLGAGDKFAATAVDSYIRGKSFEESCIIAMKATSKFVKAKGDT